MRPVGKEFVISGTLLGLTNDAGSTGLLEMSPEACGLQRHSVLFKASEGIPEFNMPHELSGMETGFLWEVQAIAAQAQDRSTRAVWQYSRRECALRITVDL